MLNEFVERYTSQTGLEGAASPRAVCVPAQWDPVRKARDRCCRKGPGLPARLPGAGRCPR